jgi:AraC-like DNA-binding protein
VVDRLRELLDLVAAGLDDPEEGGGDGLARRAGFSRDHLDRVVRAAIGETPTALRRRLLLERAAWRLREGAPASAVAEQAGYGSLAAFSRAFRRAHGVAPSGFAASDRPIRLAAPNGVHFLAPAGLTVPGRDRDGRPGPPSGPDGLAGRLVPHHLDRVRELLTAAASVPRADLQRSMRPGWRAVWFEGDEPSALLMAERLVATLEVWTAAIDGRPAPAADPQAPPGERLLERLGTVGPAFAAIARRVRDEDAWDDGFVDALCEPPQAFTVGGVLAHVVTYGAVRREMLASVLRELGAPLDPADADPILWESRRRERPAGSHRP